MDVVRAPLNRQLAESTAAAVQEAADNLVQLYKRICLDDELDEAVRKDLLARLAATAGTAQQTLRPVNPQPVSAASAPAATTTVTVGGGHNSNVGGTTSVQVSAAHSR